MAGISTVCLGLDFDNTIVSYDALFHRVAVDQGLVPHEFPADKSAIRNHLRSCNREKAWTAMQGLVYGQRMSEASPFPGVLDFFQFCRNSRISVSIISHRTLHPISGEPFDLHDAARQWLKQQGILKLMPPENVFFEQTRHAKLERVQNSSCTHFIDDLPEVLDEASFPKGVKKILFDPQDTHTVSDGIVKVRSWTQIQMYFST